MKKLHNGFKRTKLMMRSETIARLTTEQFGKIAGALGRSGETNVTVASDYEDCDTVVSQTGPCR
jgi:hypothetical protein